MRQHLIERSLETQMSESVSSPETATQECDTLAPIAGNAAEAAVSNQGGSASDLVAASHAGETAWHEECAVDPHGAIGHMLDMVGLGHHDDESDHHH